LRSRTEWTVSRRDGGSGAPERGTETARPTKKNPPEKNGWVLLLAPRTAGTGPRRGGSKPTSPNIARSQRAVKTQFTIYGLTTGAERRHRAPATPRGSRRRGPRKAAPRRGPAGPLPSKPTAPRSPQRGRRGGGAQERTQPHAACSAPGRSAASPSSADGETPRRRKPPPEEKQAGRRRTARSKKPGPRKAGKRPDRAANRGPGRSRRGKQGPASAPPPATR